MFDPLSLFLQLVLSLVLFAALRWAKILQNQKSQPATGFRLS